MKKNLIEVKSYLLVGILNFLVCVVSMKILHSLGVHYVIYTAVGYGLAICCSFYLNLKYTFTEADFSNERFVKFLVLNISNLLIVEMLEISFINHLKFQELYAVMLGMIWYTSSGFFANKYFVYAR